MMFGMRLGGIARALALSTVGLSLVAGGAGAAPSPHSPRVVGSAGVSVRLPAGWRFFRDGVAPHSMPYADPLVRIVVASTPVRPFPQGCKAETFRFSRDGVGLMVVEWLHPMNPHAWAARPRHFTAQSLPIKPGHAVECWPGRGGTAFFREGRRYFGAYLLLGAGTEASKAAQARAVLDTLTLRLKR